MHPKFLPFLCCPEDGSDLELAVDDYFPNGTINKGTLVYGEKRYPIIDGIPRFVQEELYTSSFGYEWKKWSRVQFEEENVEGKMAGHTKRMFETMTGITGDDLRNKLVVEFGCGPGRFLDVVRRKGGTVIGIERSLAVESARNNFLEDPDVLIVQGDILSPPVKKGVFDMGYTIGVLHHTPDPEKGFKKLAESVKKGGIIACSVYSKHGFYDFPSVARFRHMHNLVSPFLGNRPALGYAYFSAYVLYYIFQLFRSIPIIGWKAALFFEKYVVVSLPLPDVRWRILDIFDAITPRYASTHTSEEVSGWFERANCLKIRQTPWDPTSYTAVKG